MRVAWGLRVVRGERLRGDVVEQLRDTRRYRRFGRLLGAPVAELFAFDALLVLQAILVSASCHTVLLMM